MQVRRQTDQKKALELSAMEVCAPGRPGRLSKLKRPKGGNVARAGIMSECRDVLAKMKPFTALR